MNELDQPPIDLPPAQSESEWMHLSTWIEGQVFRDPQERPKEGQNNAH